MTFDTDTEQGMNEAQQRHTGAMYPAEIARQYEALNQVQTYSAPQRSINKAMPHGEVSTARMIKGAALAGVVIGGGYIATITVANIAAAAALFIQSFAMQIGCTVVVIAGVLIAKASKGERSNEGTRSGVTNQTITHNHYYQANK